MSIVGPDAETPLLAVELRHLDGAVGRRDPNGGSVDHLPGEFLLNAVGLAPTPDEGRIAAEHAAALRKALSYGQTIGTTRNFRDTPTPASAFYTPEVLDRLRAIRAIHDPAGVVRANHELG